VSPIIVASDLSPESDLAVSRACMLASRLNIPLIALHTVDNQLPLASQDKACAEAKNLLAKQLARCPGKEAADMQLVVKRGPVAETILRAASEESAQLLVMGKHHQRNPELFVGTTLERVSRLSSVPVLLVAGDGGGYDSGLLALDFSTCASGALRSAAFILNGGQLHALHLCNPPLGVRLSGPAAQDTFIAEQQETLGDLLEDEFETLDMLGIPRPNAKLQIQTGEVRTLLEQAIARLHPSFIALGSHSRSGMSEALLGSLALALLREPPCDVLVAR
jgi:nucleotide-binding universal stress UspA family protein